MRPGIYAWVWAIFFALWDCDLGRDISERNSGLGRVQQPSSRLIYEIGFLRKIRACAKRFEGPALPTSGGKDTFARQIREIEAIKTGDLPIVFWNTTFASHEFQRLLSIHTDPLSFNEKPNLAKVETSLGYMNRLGQGLRDTTTPPDSAVLESHLFQLQADKSFGKLILGLTLSTTGLARATRILDKAREKNRLCRNGKKTPEANYLLNVFRKFYIGEVQMYLNKIHDPAKNLLDSVNRLAKLQTVKQPFAFQQFNTGILQTSNPEGLWQQYSKQLNKHTKAWQKLLEKCGMMPTQPATDSE